MAVPHMRWKLKSCSAEQCNLLLEKQYLFKGALKVTLSYMKEGSH